MNGFEQQTKENFHKDSVTLKLLEWGSL